MMIAIGPANFHHEGRTHYDSKHVDLLSTLAGKVGINDCLGVSG